MNRVDTFSLPDQRSATTHQCWQEHRNHTICPPGEEIIASHLHLFIQWDTSQAKSGPLSSNGFHRVSMNLLADTQLALFQARFNTAYKIA